MKELEIEKRFLVPAERVEELKTGVVKGSEVWMNDVYVPNGGKHRDLRLRQMGEKYMVTRKRPVRDGDATVMLETTIEISGEEFTALAAGIETNVEKERYLVDVAEWRGELNVFRGRHEGLVTIEFEFQNEADLADFGEKADLGLRDITNVEWLAGGRLAEIDGEMMRRKLKEIKR